MAEGTRLLSEYGGQTPSRVRIPPSPPFARCTNPGPENRGRGRFGGLGPCFGPFWGVLGCPGGRFRGGLPGPGESGDFVVERGALGVDRVGVVDDQRSKMAWLTSRAMRWR